MAKRDKSAIRAALMQSDNINFEADVHTLNHSQRVALSDYAKACGYRKSISSSISLGGAFFMYLTRTEQAPTRTPGARWNNHNLAR